MILAHSIALNPNRRQSEYFARAAGTARFAYNNALAMWNAAYKADGKANPGAAVAKPCLAEAGSLLSVL